MKLAAWARSVGIHPKTAYRWFHRGTLPVPARQLDTGTILVTRPSGQTAANAAVYARVSSHDQRADLDRQVARIASWAGRHGYAVSQTEVEHRDRLARFGTEYVEAALAASGRHLVVADPGETTDDLVRDMVDVLTSFCARLYGRRSARNRALRALTAAKAGSQRYRGRKSRRASR